MSIISQIMDGNGDARRLKIYNEGQIGIVQHNHPPQGEQADTFPYREYFENAGSNNMVVNGSTTPVDFSVTAESDKDVWIKSISVYIADAGATLQEFGNLTALTNGVEFEWRSKEGGIVQIHEGIKTNLEWFRLSNQVPQIIDLSGAGADAIIVPIDLRQLFGVNWGLQLRAGSTDRLTFRVKDALAGITTFNIIAYGIKI